MEPADESLLLENSGKEQIPLDVLGELLQYVSPKLLIKLSLLCKATADDFVWRRLRTVDYCLGDESGDDWCDAINNIKQTSAVRAVHWCTPIDPYWAPQKTSPFAVLMTDHHMNMLMRVAPTLRTLSIATVFPSVYWNNKQPLHWESLFSLLNPSILEELSLGEYISRNSLVDFLTKNTFPRLRLLHIFCSHHESTLIIDALPQTCPALEEFRFGVVFHPETPSPNHTGLDLTGTMRNLRLISIPSLSITTLLRNSWNTLDQAEITRRLSRFNLDPTKVMIDGFSLWKHALSHTSGPCEALYAVCHPTPTPFALYNLLDAIRTLCTTRPQDRTEDVSKELDRVAFFVMELQKWRAVFEPLDLIERTVTPGWSLFCSCLAYLYHKFPLDIYGESVLDLITLSPSVFDIVGFNSVPVPPAQIPGVSEALLRLINDEAWWTSAGRDFNLSQTWSLHSLHNLTASGPVVLAAVKSKLLDWSLKPNTIHFFISLLGKRHACFSDGIAAYNEALEFAFQRIKESQIKPINDCLTALEISSLKTLGPIEQSLEFLCSNWKPIVGTAAAHLSPKAAFECLRHVCGADIPKQAIVDSAIAFWRPLVSNRLPTQLTYAPTPKNFEDYLSELLRFFPVVPPFVFSFLLPSRSTIVRFKHVLPMHMMVLQQTASKVLAETLKTIRSVPSSPVFIVN